MRLGILGGTFDPIHMGHLLIAEIVYEALTLDRVLFVPAGDPPHKQRVKKAAADHRQAMVNLAIDGNPHFEMCRVDLDRTGPHYSVDTVHLIRARYDIPEESCFFIIGGDSLVDLPNWHQPHKLIRLCRLAVMHRPDYQPRIDHLETVIPGLNMRVDWVPAPAINLASSLIRERVKMNLTIRYQVPDVVRAYIEQHQLYH